MCTEEEKALSEIEKAKNDALVQLSKSHDEKLKFHFDIIRYTTWIVVSLGGIIIAALAYLGFKGSRDITAYVERQSKQKAEAVISSKEFQTKIDQELGKVVQSRIEKINAIDDRIAFLQRFLGEKDQKQVVHTLFGSIDPRLAKLESMEKGAKVEFTNDTIKLATPNNDNLFLCFGTGSIKLENSKKISYEIGKNRQSFYDKKFMFRKKFTTPPVVFVQSNFIPDDGMQRKYVISAVKVDNEGFFVDFLGNGGTRDAYLLLHPRDFYFSYIAIGK